MGWLITSHHTTGNILGHLRGGMPELTEAEAKAKAKQGWDLIYKLGATLNGNGPPKLYLGPLALLSLDTPSLTPPCYTTRSGPLPPISPHTNLVLFYLSFVFKTFVSTLKMKEVFPQNSDLSLFRLIVLPHSVLHLHPILHFWLTLHSCTILNPCFAVLCTPWCYIRRPFHCSWTAHLRAT